MSLIGFGIPETDRRPWDAACGPSEILSFAAEGFTRRILSGKAPEESCKLGNAFVDGSAMRTRRKRCELHIDRLLPRESILVAAVGLRPDDIFGGMFRRFNRCFGLHPGRMKPARMAEGSATSDLLTLLGSVYPRRSWTTQGIRTFGKSGIKRSYSSASRTAVSA